MSFRIVGQRGIIERPNSPEIVGNREGTRVTLIFDGPFEALRSSRPDVNDTVDGFDDAIKVREYRIVPLRAGKEAFGRMTVRADDLGGDSLTSSSGGGEPRYELEWAQIERPIAEHPAFRDALSESAINTVVTAAQDDEPLPPASGDGADAAEALYNRLRRGVESYLVFHPIVRVTTPFSQRPQNAEAGGREDPPSDAQAPSGYEYLKTSARIAGPTQDSEWELVEEWTGADFWDPVLYPQN